MTTRGLKAFAASTSRAGEIRLVVMESKVLLLTPPSSSQHSGAQSGSQSVHKFLFLGARCSNAKLLAGLLQHGDGQLRQGASLHVSPQLFF